MFRKWRAEVGSVASADRLGLKLEPSICILRRMKAWHGMTIYRVMYWGFELGSHDLLQNVIISSEIQPSFRESCQQRSRDCP
jgi:hypothetical protein